MPAPPAAACTVYGRTRVFRLRASGTGRQPHQLLNCLNLAQPLPELVRTCTIRLSTRLTLSYASLVLIALVDALRLRRRRSTENRAVRPHRCSLPMPTPSSISAAEQKATRPTSMATYTGDAHFPGEPGEDDRPDHQCLRDLRENRARIEGDKDKLLKDCFK